MLTLIITAEDEQNSEIEGKKDILMPPYKQGVVGSSPTVPTTISR